MRPEVTHTNVLPFPHRLRLGCCKSCDQQIQAQWDLALESHYSERESAIDEMEPRMDHQFDRMDEEDDSRGIW